MKTRSEQPSRNRRGVVICGAYGMSNAGDDAVLTAIAAGLRRLDRDMPVTVIARQAKRTAGRYGVSALGRLNVPGWLAAMGRARLFLLGGGSLLQDVTSRRSLWYYLVLMRAAKAMGCAVMLYGAGIGPIRREKDRAAAAAWLDRYADVIAVRDQDSLRTLTDWGVTAPRLLLAADPALSLAQPAGERERSAAFILRAWPGFWAHVPDFAAAARYVWERYRLTPVLVCLSPSDRQAARSVGAELEGVPWAMTADSKRVGRMSLVLSMRLHGLIFALAGGAPAAGISYDPKVDAFCGEAGLPMAALEDASEQTLRDLADLAMHMDAEHISASLRTLRTREKTNLNAAAQLLAAE